MRGSTSRESLLAQFFGGARARREAFDMNQRLASSYAAVTFVLVVSVIPGIVHYHWLAGPIWQLAGFSFYAALALPGRTKHPELTAIACWCSGMLFTLLAGWAAGPPLAYLWAAAGISLPVLAVIWPVRVVLLASATLVAGCVGSGLLISPDEIRAEPLSLVLPLLAMLMCTAAATIVAAVDRRNRKAVVTDPLTGLGNRAAMAARVKALIAEGRAVSRPLSLVVVDLDHFKALNDRLGHAQGDAALRRMAIALSGELGTRGKLYRYGGEEFVALLPAASAANAEEIGERLREAVSRITIGGEPLALSGGCATATLTEDFDLDVLFRRADQALYVAKDEGRNRIHSASPVGPVAPRPALATPYTPQPRRSGPVLPKAARRDLPRQLVRTRVERDHLRAVVRALYEPANVRIMNWTLFLLAIGSSRWIGWGPAAVALVAVIVLDPKVRASTRTLQAGHRGGELAPMFEGMLAMMLVGAAIVAANAEALYALPLVITPAYAAISGYRRIGALLMWLFGSLVIVATALLVSPSAVAENPLIVTLPIGLFGTITLTGSAIASSAMEHGAAAVIDPLTDALNRSALESRLPELARECGDGPATLIVVDLDHFKAVNDLHGHGVGDVVLAAVAERLQQELRVVDALYRIGGEEFVVLLPGIDETEGTVIAERLRVAVGSAPVADIALTISLGVASSEPGVFDYAATFDRADAALFEAKRNGRDRVVVAGEPAGTKASIRTIGSSRQ